MLAARPRTPFPSIDPFGRDTIRAELYGPEHLEQHAQQLAAAAEVTATRLDGPLLRRFHDLRKALLRAHRWITETFRRRETIGTDAEWLLDNFHIVADALQEVAQDLPRGYLRELPKLAGGSLAGFPQVYALALHLIAHTDSSLDETNITRFVQAYQTVTPLTIGELWAVPIMLRLGLLENLHRLARQMLQAWHDRRLAQSKTACFAGAQEGSAPPPAFFIDLPAVLSEPLIVHLLQSLRNLGPAAACGVEWLEDHLSRRQTTAAEVLRRDHQRQAGNQVSVGNCVTSLRLLSVLDWPVFFERTSLVEAILHDDPGEVYANQDFPTKDRYRRMVERLARGSHTSELEVARRAVLLAIRHPPEEHSDGEEMSSSHNRAGTARRLPRQRHVGFYLTDGGRAELAAELGYRASLRERLLSGILRHAEWCYFGGLLVLCSLGGAGLAAFAGNCGAAWPVVLVLAATGLLPASEVAVAVINYLVTLLVPPRVLPKLDFKEFIPASHSTFVVMPTMLLRQESAAVLLERLEVHYLSNAEAHLYFALLTDFADAPSEHAPEDEALLRDALARVRALNERYAKEGQERFFLFHRKRLWNPVQQCWMGWERKRGKLIEFNRLLRGARDTSFTVVSSDPGALPFIRYVITLDADTRLPRETASRLIGALAHPLNQAVVDPGQGRAVAGYSILQPRVSFRMSAAQQSRFSLIWTGSVGIDPYTHAVSDVYQDLFGVGNFTGKGVYEVDAFQATAGGAFPANSILSHDLIEGDFARCGLVTDIEFLDDFPARYHVYARREHRWTRGDWQLLPWLRRRIPDPMSPAGMPRPRLNPLPLLERWKIVDNLRRSLLAPNLVLSALLGWLLLPQAAWAWTGVVIGVVALPLLQRVVGAALALLRDARHALRDLQADLPHTAAQVFLTLIFLADQARLQADAIARTLYRLVVSRKHLLEWETAASTERRLGADFSAFWLNMWPAVTLTAAIGGAVALLAPQAVIAATPLLLAWLISPLVAYQVSRTRQPSERPLTIADQDELRQLARKTWGFFEAFVGELDHWLPPDNFQEDPKGVLAQRTSPTNIGLLVLSTLVAHDFGYISWPNLLDRLEKTFATLDRLERLHGHFHNWYDTRTLHSLQPGYISSVDSGNLMGCLLALKHGLREKIDEPFHASAVRAGLTDTVHILRNEVNALEEQAAPGRIKLTDAGASPVDAVRASGDVLRRLVSERPETWLDWREWLDRVQKGTNAFSSLVQILTTAIEEVPETLARWTQRLALLVQERRRELDELVPWLEWLREHGERLQNKDRELADGCKLFQLLAQPGSAGHVRSLPEAVAAEIVAYKRRSASAGSVDTSWLNGLEALVRASRATEWVTRAVQLAERAGALAADMDFRFLYNGQRHLFSTGFSLATNQLDNAHYDLLASEARLTSFLAIARGHAEKRHWFQLGRPLTRAAGASVLLSWGGTMFEYLMPWLLLQRYPGTLLAESCRGAVDRQIEYGRQRRVPWGISESAFGALDSALDYQYQSFGVPGLGLKRGLAADLVIAPYATALAVMVRPEAALRNLRRLREEGAEGAYGYYEAIDYTKDRLEKKRRSLVVKSYMAHHQGMSLLALANCLFNNVMPRRFHREPMVKATDLLLQERMPRAVPYIEPHRDEKVVPPADKETELAMSRRLTTPHTPAPRTHVLSGGQYMVMVTNAGGGFSRCRGLDLTRWREDRTSDAWGHFHYIHDVRRGLVWSATHQPVGRASDNYEVIFSADKAEFHRSDAGIDTHLEIAVSPERWAEVRRLTLTNHTSESHDLEVTSYVELVLAAHAADLAHPAFGKLFLETESLPAVGALLCQRRPRSEKDRAVWAVHVLAVEGSTVGRLQYETDRARFLGRGHTLAAPAALERGALLSGRTGPVLDPIFSMRQRIRLLPGTSAHLAFTLAVADTREEALTLADQFRDPHAITRAFELAWAHSQVELRHLRLSPEEAQLYQRLTAHILYAGATMRASADVLAANRQGQSGLWRHGISGDRPIVVVRVGEENELSLVRQLLAAHAYWRLKGLEVDLVIVNHHASGYFEELHQQLQTLIRTSDAHALADKPGGIFLRKAAHLTRDDQLLLEAAARVVLAGDRGSLASQVDRPERAAPVAALLTPTSRFFRAAPGPGQPLGRREQKPLPDSLLFWNGVGGFTADGREYVIPSVAQSGNREPAPSSRSARATRAVFSSATPTPWINVIANPQLGFLISESGSGFTWAGNSQSNRLTPWSNDPVADAAGEAVYLRDEETGVYWTPTLLPCGGGGFERSRHVDRPVGRQDMFRCRHGQGYTVFEHHGHGLAQELLLFVSSTEPIKIIRLRVRNDSAHTRRLSATLYVEWVLGVLRDQAPMQVITEIDPDSGALLARNPFHPDFSSCAAFVDVSLRPRTCTGDRTEFLGRNGSLAAPAALARVGLSGRIGPGLDPCAAVQAPFSLERGESRDVIFLLGQASDASQARRLVTRLQTPAQVQAAWETACARWDQVLTAIQVQTPNRALDVLLNRWVLYQVLSCRVWARSAFYQSGGAYGFRDQLQDVMALVYGSSADARRHIIRAAGRQFVEGDVQHWWHPPAGRGVRTRFSDDFLWLPYVVCHYIRTTGDARILDESIPFLKAPLLKPDQEEEYGLPETSAEMATLYEHCVRALENGWRLGSHGLPLMGTGDWNDGMNRVGVQGKGESVWNGWFQIATLRPFADVAESRGDNERAAWCRQHADQLGRAVEDQAWDGQWYRRAYFDDGTPLGSSQNDECAIDSIVQSWAVLCGAARSDRAAQAMDAVYRQLVRQSDRLILLFAPPFDRGKLQPGYIKGYVPGIRENGGQYTHAATWVVQAAALLGHGDRAMELFDLLNPILHATNRDEVDRYRVEPYVVAADVYSEPPHTGRGGWTWYTGSAGWVYRVVLETILGFHLRGGRLIMDPCIPRTWPRFVITFRHASAIYEVAVENPDQVERGVRQVELDGEVLGDPAIPLHKDGRTHHIRVVMGSASPAGSAPAPLQ
jgi:cyclic beta-1,2-glucan synthetase